jgi:hypothetical protein
MIKAHGAGSRSESVQEPKVDATVGFLSPFIRMFAATTRFDLIHVETVSDCSQINEYFSLFDR